MNTHNKPDDTQPPLTLRILDADNDEQIYRCDSVHLCSKDGSVGIRKGHIKAVISLTEQKITAYTDGQKIFESGMLSGIATVENDTVLVLKD